MSVSCRCCGASVGAGIPCPIDGTKNAAPAVAVAPEKSEWVASADVLESQPEPKMVPFEVKPRKVHKGGK